ncbi:NmrA family transcriptional regulator [Agromyces sp. LHK192]|uniref:NmrA family NAD(P)-binding protein n=1 Tax=Agromyces sp. LHK192 TaxID=2498704 RepID=UPI000FD83920|nr:NmrA family transcriptional regulator [Agromyces sp. LHK192]
MTEATRRLPHDERPVLVTGATGKVGRRVVDRLRADGLPARAASRSLSGFEWDDPDTWGRHFDGAASVVLSYAPDIAYPGAGASVERFAAAAAAAGIRRAVLLSGRGEEAAVAAEALVRTHLPALTVVRGAFFAQNFTEGALAESVAMGELALPAPDAPEPFVDAEDVAAMIAVTAARPGHEGRVYEATGPALLTFREAATAVAAARGASVHVEQVPVAEWTEQLRAAGLPDDLADLLGHLFTEVVDGRNAHVSPDVEAVTGRPPTPFAAFVRRDVRARAVAPA